MHNNNHILNIGILPSLMLLSFSKFLRVSAPYISNSNPRHWYFLCVNETMYIEDMIFALCKLILGFTCTHSHFLYQKALLSVANSYLICVWDFKPRPLWICTKYFSKSHLAASMVSDIHTHPICIRGIPLDALTNPFVCWLIG